MAVRDANKRIKTMKQQLPPEILVRIASKLPATSILQCRQPLSHNMDDFDTIISDPLFPLLFHDNCNSSQNTSILAYDSFTNTSTLIDYEDDRHLIEFCIDNMDYIRRLEDKSSRKILSNCSVVASCNGWLLVCLLLGGSSRQMNSVSASLRLVNPITRSFVVLPEAPYALSWQDLKYGLGYGSKTGLLKVVRLYHQPDSAKITAEVLTVYDEECTSNNNSTWEVMDAECSVGLSAIRSEAVSLNGALHWLVDDNNLILRFDLDKEKFEFIPSPCSTKTSDNEEHLKMTVSYLGALDGLLCVGAACGSTLDKGVEIWVMKEYGIEKSWTRFTVIDDLDIIERLSVIPVLKNGKLLILTTLLSHNPDGEEFYLDVYDPKERKRDQRVPLLQEMDAKTRGRMTAHHFVPSFLSLKQA